MTDGNLWVADSGNGRVLRFPHLSVDTGSLQTADLVLGQSDFTHKDQSASAQTMNTPLRAGSISPPTPPPGTWRFPIRC